MSPALSRSARDRRRAVASAPRLPLPIVAGTATARRRRGQAKRVARGWPGGAARGQSPRWPAWAASRATIVAAGSAGAMLAAAAALVAWLGALAGVLATLALLCCGAAWQLAQRRRAAQRPRWPTEFDSSLLGLLPRLSNEESVWARLAEGLRAGPAARPQAGAHAAAAACSRRADSRWLH